MSGLVGNPEGRFSRDAAQIIDDSAYFVKSTPLRAFSVSFQYFADMNHEYCRCAWRIHLSNILTDHLNILEYEIAWLLPNNKMKLLLPYYTMT